MSDTRLTRNGSDAAIDAVPSPVLTGLAVAFRHVTVGMAVGGVDGRVIDVNPALASMLGSGRDALLARDLMAIVYPGEPETEVPEWGCLAAGEIDSFEGEQRYARDDGSVLWGLVTVSALRDDAGQFLGGLAQIQDITARKTAEAALGKNEARLVSLVGQFPVALYSQEPGAGGAFHSVSPLFEQLTGLGQDELPTSFESLLARVHPEDRAAVQAADDQAGRSGEPAQLRYRIRGGNGEWVWVDNRSVLMRDDQGRPVAWHGALLEITARMRLEASLRASETRFRRAFEDAAIGMSLGGPDHRCLDVNAAYCRIVGESREALIGRPFAELTHPDDVETYLRQVERLHAGEIDAYEIEKRYVRPDGTIVIGRLTVSAVRDEAGEFLYDIGQLQDVTAYKEASAALRESQTRLRELVEHLPASLYRQDTPGDGSTTYVSPGFSTMLGLDPDDLPLGFPAFFERIHPDDRDAVTRSAAWAERTGEPMDIEYRIQRGDGDWTWIHDRSALDRDALGQPRSWTGVLLDISERKQLEIALRESEAHLRTIVEQAPAAVYRLEPGAGGRFTYASPRFSALTGLSLDRRNGDLEAFFTRVHPDDVESVRAADVASGDTGDGFDLEYRMLGQDGAWVWVQDRSTLTRDEAGNPLAWHGILLDITERKRLETSLRESEERFRSIFEGAGIGMMQVDPRGPILEANRSICRMLGYSRDELLEMTFFDLTHPSDLMATTEAARRVATGEINVHIFEKRCLHKEGQTVWSDVTLNPVRGADGAPLCLIAQVQDITARKEAEAALRESEARFRALVQNDPDVIAVIDAAWQVSYMSPSAEGAFGMPLDAMLGDVRARLQFIHPEDKESALALFQRVDDQRGATASTEARLWHEEHGWRWFQVTVSNQLAEPSIAGYVFNVRDITERKQAALALEAALETQRAAITELELLNQSKSRFLSTISHEFRTPLTAIIGYSELLVDSVRDPAAIAEDAAVIHREASRLNRMVDDVLLVDRAGAGHLPLNAEPVDVNALVEDVVTTFRPLIESHRLSLALDPDLAPIPGDRDRLLQAVTNLVSNAVKYSPGGGRISIVTRDEGDEVLLSVQDEGIGIAASDLPRIFDRFERVETGIAGRIGGTGLGLSIVREIAGLHGGRVWAESAPGVGSTFFLALPGGRG